MGQENPERAGNYWNGDRAAVPKADAEDFGGVGYTHYVSSLCEHQGNKGINLRSESLSDQELVAAQRDTAAGRATLIAWLDNGARLRLIDSRDGWHIVAAQIEEGLALGFISASCSSKPTILRLGD